MRFESPDTIEQAVELLNTCDGISRLLAGGTDVLVQLRLALVEPDLIVDIKNIAGMRNITAEDGGFRIGAAVSGAEMGEHEGLVALWPGVVEAMELVGSTQVQGRATLAGNLCNASPAADSVPAMVVANAVARIVGPNGTRDCPVIDIPVGPSKTSLAKGEVITSIYLPARPDNSGDAYLRFIPRTEMDIAVSSAGVNLTIDSAGVVTQAQVSLGAVAPTVLVVDDAAKAIIGTKLDDDAISALQAACSAACNPIDDKRGTVEFRTKTAGVMAKRAALIAYSRAGGSK
ncbi:MAG: xanthine dehydrogenase family protein subunit M [Rhodobacteraceae bacterium]|nr:xanthine dehydrogenase family protein subunit M [Paracoccaceae bacterium]